MVQTKLLALRPVDRLIAGYLVFAIPATLLIGGVQFSTLVTIAMYALCGVLLILFIGLDPSHSIGNTLHTIYPLILLIPLYTAIGVVNSGLDPSAISLNDVLVQGWEDTLFHGQPSYYLIRRFPSVAASWIFHSAYLIYYPILLAGPIYLVARGRHSGARRIVFGMMTAFVICYVFFTLFPVSGPNWSFEHPTGPVREVFPARMVYATLATGSAFGTAFPSSHVAATVAATIGAWCASPRMGRVFLVPCILLTLATVYTQMHYAVDAIAGLAVGLFGGWAATKVEP